MLTVTSVKMTKAKPFVALYVNNCVISVKSSVLFFGRYEENNLKVGRKKINLMFVGDGKGKTVISGGKSIFDNITTFHTATFGKLSFTYTISFSLFNFFQIIQQ